MIAPLFAASSPSLDTILSVAASIVVAAGINYLVSAKSAAKFEGATVSTLDNHAEAIKELKTSRTEMWVKINENSADIAGMSARCNVRHGNGKAHHV